MLQIESSIPELFLSTENSDLFKKYGEAEWLALAEKIKAEGKLIFETDAIASVLYWIYSGKPKYEFSESSQSSNTVEFSKEETKFSSGHQASFIGDGEKGVKILSQTFEKSFF